MTQVTRLFDIPQYQHETYNLKKALTTKYDNITVAGIAGPGDAFAQPDVVMETLSQKNLYLNVITMELIFLNTLLI